MSVIKVLLSAVFPSLSLAFEIVGIVRLQKLQKSIWQREFFDTEFLRWYDPLSSLRSTVVRHFCVGEKVANDHHYYKMSCVTNKSQGQSRFYKTGALSNQKRRFLTSKNRCGSMQFIFCRHFFFQTSLWPDHHFQGYTPFKLSFFSRSSQ